MVMLPKKISFVSGNFNLLHPGHLRLLRFAAEISDELVVAVNPDGTPGVTVPCAERLQNVMALDIVTRALVLGEPLEDCLAELKPNFVVKGKEFENQDNKEEAVLAQYGGKLIFSSGEMQFSSMGMLESEFKNSIIPNIHRPLAYIKHHEINPAKLRKYLQNFGRTRMLVIGDLIVDDYIDCEPLGMSQEDPTIVVSPISTKRFIGGAGIVSAHASSLGATVEFVTVTGDDKISRYSHRFFKDNKINYYAHLDKTRPTTLKQRYRANGKALLRINHLRQHDISKEQCQILIDHIKHFPLTFFGY